MNTKSLFGLIIVGIVLLILSASVYIVKDYEKAIVLRFGDVHNSNVEPGLRFKVPPSRTSLSKWILMPNGESSKPTPITPPQVVMPKLLKAVCKHVLTTACVTNSVRALYARWSPVSVMS